MRAYSVSFQHLGYLYEVVGTYDASGPAGCTWELEEITRDGKPVEGADFDGLNNEIDPTWNRKLGEALGAAYYEER